MKTELETAKQAVLAAGAAIGSVLTDDGCIAACADKQGRGNFVTAADYASEKAVVATIRAQYPADAILSEESYAQTQPLSDIERLWIIDPLDGTNNFRFGRRYYCVSVAFARFGTVFAGAVYDPAAKDLFYAERGQGSYCSGKRLAVRREEQLLNCSLATDNSYDIEETKANYRLLLNLPALPWVLIRGSAVLGICDVARGAVDLYFHTKLCPWDIAAASLIAEEAGAHIRALNGESAALERSDAVVGHGPLVATFLNALGLGG